MAEANTPQESAAKKASAEAAPEKAAAMQGTEGGTPGDDAGRQRPAERPGHARGPKHTPRTPKPRGQRKTRIGYVVSDKMHKTIVVELEDRVRHPLYGKIIRTTKKVKAHDENGIAGIGDRVSLMETRPLSATKRWRLVDILEKAK
ncbi:30S ribosomal protein S17 [Candidatus Mycobacterium methanotrophicum]|uniref:Small ribosomal subunit protein uS17 n=1 Tax=Candidatus Mycobacterium methanotrophicum TaxID=2943498 RepID=A0ABY4QMR5_9MYCO|nr:30S ribosomal protein S17 [Candidatus Mycobacterium methanotrophicum]UQX11603.1 30S ribosomal protein S17 [Candidatus Mycobacterium methanotrophicum]